HPTVIARKMRKTIVGMSKHRAERIARTEVIHAHAEGPLDSYERLGVEEVGLLAELSTADDDRVCPICSSKRLEGPVQVSAAHGIIPLHPNCRCAWTPYLTDLPPGITQ